MAKQEVNILDTFPTKVNLPDPKAKKIYTSYGNFISSYQEGETKSYRVAQCLFSETAEQIARKLNLHDELVAALEGCIEGLGWTPTSVAELLKRAKGTV